MAERLTALFSSLAPLWEMSLTAAFAAAVVLVLRLLLKRRAPRQVVCLLWLIVFARLLIPFSLESPVSLVPQALTEQPAPAVSQPAESLTVPTPAVPTASAGASAPSVSAPPVASTPISTAGPIEHVDVQAPPVNVSAVPYGAVLAGVWLAGAAAMLLYGIFSYVRLRRRMYDAIRAEDGAWEHPAVRSPFILGLFRPKIYLPAGLSGPARQFILCHEQAHLKRLDYIVKPVCWLALALHWFNPMAWAAFLLMSRDMEVACDQAVIRRLGDGVKADYSATLLSLATGGKFPAPCPLAFGEGDAKGRIKSVLSYKKPTLWIIVAAVAVAVIAAVCLLTDPKSPAAEDPEPSASPSAQPEPTPSAGLDGYVTYSYYPGLYFLEETGDNGSSLTTAYRLNGGEPELVGSYQGYPGSDEDCAMFEQLLVDTCAALDSNWADTLPTERTGPYAEGFMYLASVDGITLFSTPQWNTLLRYGDRLQVLAQQPYGAHGTAPGLQWADLDGDGQNELAVIYKELATGTHQSIDALVVYEWDGARWTAHPHDLSAAIERATDSMAYAVNRSAGTCSTAVLGLRIELELDPNALEQWDRLFDGPYELYLEPSYSYQYGFSAGGGFSLALLYSLMPGSRDNLAMCSDVFHLIYQVQYRPDGTFADTAVDLLPISTNFAPGPLGKLPGELVTPSTLPSDPEEYYLVAQLPEDNIRLYARDYGRETLLVWENFWRPYDYTAHTGHMILPRMAMLEQNCVGAISQVNTGTGVGVEELVVYDLRDLSDWRDYRYDWTSAAAEFNRNNTLVYDGDANSLAMTYGGVTYHTGTLTEDLGAALDLEDGFTGAAIADGSIVSYQFNGDGTVQITMATCIARGGQGHFDEEGFWHGDGDESSTYPMSTGVTGFELTWAVHFTGNGFETVPGSFEII